MSRLAFTLQFAKVAGVARALWSHGTLCCHLMASEGTGDLGLKPAKFEFNPTLASLGFWLSEQNVGCVCVYTGI